MENSGTDNVGHRPPTFIQGGHPRLHTFTLPFRMWFIWFVLDEIDTLCLRSFFFSPLGD